LKAPTFTSSLVTYVTVSIVTKSLAVDVLRENREDYYETLAEHTRRHLEAFGLKRQRIADSV